MNSQSYMRLMLLSFCITISSSAYGMAGQVHRPNNTRTHLQLSNRLSSSCMGARALESARCTFFHAVTQTAWPDRSQASTPAISLVRPWLPDLLSLFSPPSTHSPAFTFLCNAPCKLAQSLAEQPSNALGLSLPTVSCRSLESPSSGPG